MRRWPCAARNTPDNKKRTGRPPIGAVPFACRKSSPAAIFSARCLRNVCAGGANSPPARQSRAIRIDFGGPAGPPNLQKGFVSSLTGRPPTGAVPFACRKSSPAAIFSARCLRNVCAGGANSPPARQSRAIRIDFGGPAGPPNLRKGFCQQSDGTASDRDRPVRVSKKLACGDLFRQMLKKCLRRGRKLPARPAKPGDTN